MGNTWVVDKDFDGVRLDRFLRKKYTQVPLSAIMRAIRTGEVTVNGKKASPSYRLCEKDQISVPFEDPKPKEPSMKPSDKFLEVLFMDENILVVNKPSDLLSQPASGGDDSVVNRAMSLANKTDKDFIPTPVHRLDRNVSGVMLLALNIQSLRALTGLFRDRKIIKRYLAVVKGPLEGEGIVDVSLNKDKHSFKARTKYTKGKRSITRYRALRVSSDASLVELELITGRFHQLRAHLSHIGHPIIGDVKYGGRKKEAPRPMLHAYVLEFTSKDRYLGYLFGKKFTAPMPIDMKEIVKFFELSP